MTEEKKNNIEDVILNEKKEFKIPENGNNNKRNLVLLFFTTFVFGIIAVSFFLKELSPNMDLDIGENPIASMNQRDDGEEDYSIRSQVDRRLKMIQNDDEMPGVSEKNIDEDGYEKPEDIVKRLREKVDNKSDNNEDEITLQKNETDSHTIEPVKVQIQDAIPQSSISKIYIGQYSSMEKAVEMQEAVVNADLGVNPVIRLVNGYYTIQAGAFSNPESAKSLANQLIDAGFAAKIVKEIR